MRSLRTRWAVLACAAIGMLGAALPAAAEQVAALRVMLHPYAAARGELPPDARATLEALAGTALTLTGTTRTGALELALPAPVPEAEAIAMVKALRVDRSVLWAEPIRTPVLARKSSAGDPRGEQAGPAAAGPAQGRRHAGLARAAGAARQPDRDDGHAGTPDRQHFRAERSARPESRSCWRNWRRRCRATRTSSTPIRCAVRIRAPRRTTRTTAHSGRCAIPWPASTRRPRGNCSRARRT